MSDAYKNTIAEALSGECGYCRGMGQVNQIDGGAIVCNYCSGRGHVFGESDVKAFIYNMAQKPNAHAMVIETARLINKEGNTLHEVCILVEYLHSQLNQMTDMCCRLLDERPDPIVITKGENENNSL